MSHLAVLDHSIGLTVPLLDGMVETIHSRGSRSRMMVLLLQLLLLLLLVLRRLLARMTRLLRFIRGRFGHGHGRGCVRHGEWKGRGGVRWVQVDVDGVPVLRGRSSRCSRVDLVEGSGPDYIVWSRMVKGERALTSGTSGSSACGLRFLVPTTSR